MKKLLSTLLAISLLVTGTAVFSFANAESFVQNEPTVEAMEEMIKKVRPLIDVPESYTDFSWNYNAGSVYKEASWRFSWTDREVGRINVYCDDLGRIYNYSIVYYNLPHLPALPEKSPEEFEDVAEGFIKRTAPHFDSLDLRLSSVNVGSITNPTYTYYFTRYENGLIVPEQTISVTLSAIDGTVSRFYANITLGIEFESAEPLISQEKAKEILSTVQNMILSYKTKTEYDDEGNVTSTKAYLVYTPEHSYLSVDAVTGEIYTERNTWETISESSSVNGSLAFDKNFSSADSAVEESETGGSYVLTEEEQAQLEVLKNLISRDEAIKAVVQNEDLYIDPLATVIKATLTKDSFGYRPLNDGEEKEGYVWSIEFSAPETIDRDELYYYHGMTATVDAQTGELIKFYAEIPDYYYYKELGKEAPKAVIDKDEAQAIAQKFIEKMQPEKAKSITPSSYDYGYITLDYTENEDGSRSPVYGGKSFRFNRVNEGIEYTPNSFRVGVEFITGKIINYSYTWQEDIIFESPKDMIGEKEALMSLYSYDGFGVNYEVNAKYSYNEYLIKESNGEYIDYDTLYDSAIYTRPVYSAYNLGTTIIRASDGKMITYGGEEYVRNDSLYSYSDIESHWAKDTIIRFSYVGFGVDGKKFEPNKEVDGEFFSAICDTLGLYSRTLEINQKDILTRMDAVKYIITYLGYDKIARLENVFITDFVDNSDFKAEDIGFAAIARGFGIIEGDGESFRPYDTLTRAEALTLAKKVIDNGILDR